MAQQFRLVKYSNLPRYSIYIYIKRYIAICICTNVAEQSIAQTLGEHYVSLTICRMAQLVLDEAEKFLHPEGAAKGPLRATSSAVEIAGISWD